MRSKLYEYLAVGACALACAFTPASAQSPNPDAHCGTKEAMDELFRNHPEVRSQYDQLRQNSLQSLSQFRTSHPYTQGGAPDYIIPVVFHIIHEYGAEDISDAQVQDEMNILNRDYRSRNGDTSQATPPFKPIIADTKIEFRLATKDPDGNCTNGIEHIYSHKTRYAGDDSKLDAWPRDRYLNVWIVKQIGTDGTIAGYAYFPSQVTGVLFTIDGVIILHDYVGAIGTGTVQHSRALTHEIGHYLNLEHPWGMTNTPGVACGDDGIADTPITKGWYNVCPPGPPSPLYPMDRVVCSLPNDTIVENVENYMEYSYCSVMFTLDQAAAMQQTLNSHVSYRDDLWKYGNHVATGIDSGSFLGTYADSNYFFPDIIPGLPVCAPVADFSANRKYICQGGTVTFTDHSWRAATTSLSWSFPNGNPSTSTSPNPTVTFNTWGWQNISLTAINGNGADTKTVNNMVFVAPPWADYFGAFSEGFENNNFSNLWIVDNEENSYPQWQQTNTAAYSGTSSVMLNAYGEDRDLYDAFMTPSYDLSTCSNATLNFKYSCASAAQWNTDIKETLLVYVSNNCGQTWVQRKLLTGTALCNAGYYPSAFTPNSQSQWASCSIQLQNVDLGSKTRFRFQFYSGRFPNNIFIDDINLQATVGVNEIANYYFNLNVFPNPAGAENTISISYSLNSQEKIKISLIDMVGREINVLDETQMPGERTVNIDRHALDLKAGVYLVKISNGSSYDTRKLVITN